MREIMEMLFSVNAILSLVSLWLFFNITIYYPYICLNKTEKKYGIKRKENDNFFMRIYRTAILSRYWFLMHWKRTRWGKFFISRSSNSWYGRQYLEKIPYEEIKRYRWDFIACIAIFLIEILMGFLNRMGWNYSFYWG